MRCAPTVWMLLLSFLLIAAPGPSAAEGAGERLGDDVVPTSQTIQLEIDARGDDYRGSVRIELDVQRAVDTFRFHAEGLTLERVTLSGASGAVAVRHAAESDEIVRLTAEAPLTPGAYALEIDFSNVFDTQAVSLYRMEQDGVGYVFTQFQADDAREAFPCWDEPIFKIPFQMTLKVPAEHLAVTNTPIEEEAEADGWRTVRFRQTKPLPSYLLAIAAGPLETVAMPGLGVPGRLITVRGQSHLTGLAAQMTPPILKAMEKYFERPYPYAKLDFLALPEFWPGAMENAGAVTYADRILLADAATASVSQRRRMARVIAHELAHMWFGDLVTLAWWDDLWLNESFATWMGDKIVDEVFPQFATSVAAAQDTQGVLGQDARATTKAIRKPVRSARDLAEGIGLAYQKGRAVLGMFEQWLGPETFRRGVIEYINRHAWGNAVAADLWQALDKASGKKAASAMATFIEQPGFPLIDLRMQDDGKLVLHQERFRNHGSESADISWRIPVSLKISNGGAVVEKTVLVDATTYILELGDESPAWIFPNAAANGYYRWRMPPEPLRALAKNASQALTPRERVELIGNVSALLGAGTLAGDQYLGVLADLADDPDPLVIRALVEALESVKMAFVPADLEEAFAAYVRRTLGPAMERFGLQKTDGEAEAVSLVRPTLYTWLGREGRDANVLAASQSLAQTYLEGGEVDSALAGVALQLAARRGDRKLFDTYTQRLESAESPAERQRFLGAIGHFTGSELQKAALSYSLQGPLRPNELFTPTRGVATTVAGRDLAYLWLTENYGAVIQRVPPMFAAFLPFFADGCSAERIEKAKVFFAQPDHGGEPAAKQLAQV
ncbi:MAG: M1 family metallopeptidase, partial [Acidobacteriota bacterium]